MRPQLLILALLALSVSCKQKEAPPATETQSKIISGQVSERIDSLLNSFVETGKLAGASALIFEKGQEVYYNAFGYANREDSVPMARNTIVQIYSMTKPITGTTLMRLYEKDSFDLDDPLTNYAPEFKNMQVYTGVNDQGEMQMEPIQRPISIRDITRHTAGFPNRPNIPGLGEALVEAAPLDRNKTLEEMAATFGKLPLWFQPGAQWEYGPSVDVQAFLAERISGIPFDVLMRESVLDPLGMSDTRYFVPEKDRERFSAMYYLEGDSLLRQLPDEEAKIEYFDKFPLKRGGWGLTSTLDDYMRFGRMLLNDGSLDGVQILKPETVRLMRTNHLPDSVTERSWLPSKGQVGFGIDFAVRHSPPVSAEENNGVVGEFFWDGAASTLFWVDPQNELVAVLFVQLFPYDPIKLHKKFRDAVYGPVQVDEQVNTEQ